MNIKTIQLIIFFVLNFKICQGTQYENFTLFHVVPTEAHHLEFLQNLEKEKYIQIIFWRRPYKLYHSVQFMVHQLDKSLLLERVNHFKINVEVLLDNVQSAFNNQINYRKYIRLKSDSFSWKQYHDVEDINQWLADMALKFSKIAELESYGKSAEGRDLYAMSIKRPGAKKVAIVEGGIHGHEWVSPAFVTYLIDKLLYADDIMNAALRTVAYSYHWYLIPLVNPDGYVYSHKTNRLWRKNRRHIKTSYGVDLDRNFDYSFGKYDTSNDPLDERYCGPSPLSEPETQYLAEFITQKKADLKFYFSIHSYGQMIVIPYSDRVKHVENFSEMENYGKQALIKMFKLYGVKYQLGTTFDTMGTRVSGNSASWVKKNFKTQYVITFMLRDNGTYGLALPPEQIIPSCDEALVGLVEIMTANPKHVVVTFRSAAASQTFNFILICMFIYIILFKIK